MLLKHDSYQNQREWCEENAQGDCSVMQPSESGDPSSVVFVHESRWFVTQGRYLRHLEKNLKLQHQHQH